MTRADPFIDEAAEAAVVGTVLDEPERLAELEDLQPEHMASAKGALVLTAIRALESEGIPVNNLSVSQWLKDRGKLVAVGGPGFLMKLGTAADDLIGYSRLAEQVARLKDLADRRAGRAALRAQQDALLDMSKPVSVVLLDAAGKLTEQGSRGGTHVPTGQQVMERSRQRIDNAQSGQGKEKYIRTGLKAWDEYIGGVIRRRVILVAAHPGVGKSGLMYSMGIALADGEPGAEGKLARRPERVYFGHLEDEAESFTDRSLAEHSGLSLRELGSAGLSREQMESLDLAQSRLHEAMGRIRIDDKRGMDVKELVARARYYVRSEGCSVVMVDHGLQLIQDPSKLGEKVFVIVNTLADFSHAENVAVVLALHLSDPEDKKVDARYVRPTIQMMAGGRSMERAARVIAGMRLCPPPKPPALKKGEQRQPRGKNVNEELLEKWQAEQRANEAEYHREVAKYEAEKRRRENRVLISAVKANEGRMGYEFWMERVAHAGLFHRDRGGAKDGELGFSPGPASSEHAA